MKKNNKNGKKNTIDKIDNKEKKDKKHKNKKNKRNILALVAFFFVLGIGVVISYFLLYDSEIIYKKNIKIKVGEIAPNKIDYKINNKKLSTNIKWDELTLEEGKAYYPGKYKGVITIKDKEYGVNLTVVDSEKPVIEGAKDFEIRKGDNVDLLKDIKVVDNTHEEIKAKVIGDYDVNVAGEYALSYEASDKSGNVGTANFKLIVKDVTDNNQVGNSSFNYFVGKTSKGYDIEVRNGVYYINNILIANKSYNLPDTYAPGGLLQELNDAFYRLQSDAANEGLNIYVISGYRSYWDQNYIYNNYVARDGQALADTYSARPGHSEHQTGLAADVNSLETWFGDQPEGIWLKNNCYKYGFIIRYPYGKDSITGYQYEPWHIRYVGVDVATALYNNGDWITLEEYLGIDSYYH